MFRISYFEFRIFDVVCSLDSNCRHDTLKKRSIFFISRQFFYPANLKDYFPFLIFCLFRPFYFINTLSQTNSPVWSVVFFSINFSLALFIWALENLFETPQKKVLLQALSEVIFFFIPGLIGFLLLAAFLHVISVIFGSRAKFSQTLSVMGLSSFGLIMVFIPSLSAIGLLFWCALMVMSFQKIHQYKAIFAVLIVASPFFILTALMLVTGFLKLPFEISTLSQYL